MASLSRVRWKEKGFNPSIQRDDDNRSVSGMSGNRKGKTTLKPGQIIDAVGPVAYIKMELEYYPYPDYEQGARFHLKRKWEFDFAWYDLKIALEYEGAPGHNVSKAGKVSKGSGHVNYYGRYTKDCEKYNAAQILGWIVIRATRPLLESGAVFEDLKDAFESRDYNTGPEKGGRSRPAPKGQKPRDQGVKNARRKA